MENRNPGWDDEEQTIVSFSEKSAPASAPPAESSAPAGPGPTPDDPEGTVFEREPPAGGDEGEGGTIYDGGERKASATGEMAWLVLAKTRSVRRGDMYKLDRDGIQIGRNKADIPINDPKVSDVHAKIRYGIGGVRAFVLHDMGSTNGTFVNGQRVGAPVTLKDGDRIGLGDTELVFKQV